MKNIYCIVGPSGCGKTTLVQALEAKYGYKVIESYTTRSPRFEGETGHIFVSPEEFQKLGKMCAYTLFDGAEYGVTADLIENNDLYVFDPDGVAFLREQYTGNKGVKVIGITADIDVLIERMQQRGDSDEKIVQRLMNDAECFKDLSYVTDIILRSDVNSADELCEAAKYHVENFEYWAYHEFALLDAKGGEIKTVRSPSLEMALEFYSKVLSKDSPEGLPAGWCVKDYTEEARRQYVSAIKKLRPSFHSSMIDVCLDNAGTSRGGYTAVHFKYNRKNYCYRSYNGNEWISDETRILPASSGEAVLKNQIEFLRKKIDKLFVQSDDVRKAELNGRLALLETAYQRLIENNKNKASLSAKISDAEDKKTKGNKEILFFEKNKTAER